jgi:osmotically inducible protein OsmC
MRFQDEPGTNPEELIAAAHAGCFSMDISSRLSKAGHVPTKICTTAKVHLTEGPTISLIELETVGEVPGIDEQTFKAFAEESRKGCPVSRALSAVEMRVSARLA